MTKTFDFDAWYDETRGHLPKTRPMRLAGRLWQIPADPTYAALRRVQELYDAFLELNANPGGPVPAALDSEAHQPEPLLRELVGDDLVDQWIEAGITGDRLQNLVGVLYQMYGGGPAFAVGVVEAEDGGDDG